MDLKGMKRVCEAAHNSSPTSPKGLLFYAAAHEALPRLIAVAVAAKAMLDDINDDGIFLEGLKEALAELENGDGP